MPHDELLTGDSQFANVVWVVTATSEPDADTMVWGTSDAEGDTVVWGTTCRDPDCGPVVWQRQ